jgi:hypothetical protein
VGHTPHVPKPRRGPPAAAGGVDDQVRGEYFLRAPAAGQHPGAGDPVACWGRGQSGHIAPVPDQDVRQGPDPATDLAFQERPARLVDRVARFTLAAQQLPPAENHSSRYSVKDRHPGRQAGQYPGEQLVEDLRAAGQQRVRVPALRDPRPVCPMLGQRSRSTTVTRC